MISLSMCIPIIFVLFTSIVYIEGIDINLNYCKFQCSQKCDKSAEESNPIISAKTPSAYYWRDFYGVAPIDAYPLGPPTQFPQTYLGVVYDPSRNGTFVTTIYNGLDYVYTVLKNKTVKVDKQIQILCTKHPEQLHWLKVTKENVKTVLSTYQRVRGYYHEELVNNKAKPFHHYIVKTNKCRFPYAGAIFAVGAKLEYSLIDGSFDTTDQYLWLLYKKDPSGMTGSYSPMSTLKGNFNLEAKTDINSAQLSTKITIGPCSASCSTDAKITMDSTTKMENALKLSASMAYYWRPTPVIKQDEAFLAGEDYLGSLYIGQAYISNNLDVGSSNLKTATVNEVIANVETNFQHVLSTNNPKLLKWVNTTAQDFSKQDKNKMIPGGARENGTETFVCREVDKALSLPGSARVLETGTYCYAPYGPVEQYQILMINPTIIDPKSVIDKGIIKESPIKDGTKIKLKGF